MARKGLILFSVLFVFALLMGSCKARKGCGCMNNLNYYKPKKSRSR